jgi:hypothetical protein
MRPTHLKELIGLSEPLRRSYRRDPRHEIKFYIPRNTGLLRSIATATFTHLPSSAFGAEIDFDLIEKEKVGVRR